MDQNEYETIHNTGVYASDCLSEIPMGYWIDKSVGGCGLSYLALKDKYNAIILMPRIALIENKLEQKAIYPNIFGVKGDTTMEDVVAYAIAAKKEFGVAKICCTYDAFAQGKMDSLVATGDYRIYVDESQYLLDFTVSKAELAIELHSKLAANIKLVSFFSAHPPKTEYMPEYIQKMPKIKYTWENQVRAIPYIINTTKPYHILTKLLRELAFDNECVVDDLKFEKVIIFLNSVDKIKDVIKKSGVNSKDVAYIVGDTVKNSYKLKNIGKRLTNCRKLPMVTIGTTSMISGIDLYDDKALNIVVSTSTNDWTLFDKELDVPQAITRQRIKSNPFINKFIFIVDKEDMKEKVDQLEEVYKKSLQELEDVVYSLNYLQTDNAQKSKHQTITKIAKDKLEGYFSFVNGQYISNQALLLAKKYVFKELFSQYTNGYNVIGNSDPEKRKVVEVNTKGFVSTSYAQYVEEIKAAETNKEKIAIIKNVHNKDWRPILMYGFEQDNLLTNSKHAQAFYLNRDSYGGIKDTIYKIFTVGEKYANIYIKNQLQEIYNKKNIQKTAKATDLNEFFKCKRTTAQIDGHCISMLFLEKKV